MSLRDLHLLSKFGVTKSGRDSIDGKQKLFSDRKGPDNGPCMS